MPECRKSHSVFPASELPPPLAKTPNLGKALSEINIPTPFALKLFCRKVGAALPRTSTPDCALLSIGYSNHV
jgi:hypothetical protein